MPNNLNIALTLSLNDRLVKPIERALKEIQSNIKALEKDLSGVEKASAAADRAMASMKGPEQALRATQAAARETEKWARVVDGLQRAWRGAGMAINAVSATTAALAAAKMVTREPLQQARDYHRALVMASNTAFSERDTAGRVAGARQMDADIRAALRIGGGTREGALAALQKMYASGQFKDEEVRGLLPDIMKVHSGTDADPFLLAQAASDFKQQGYDVATIRKMFDMMDNAGKLGSFEIKDMVSALPKQMGAMNIAGMRGVKDVASVLAMNEAAMTVAGTPEQAAVVVENYLRGINSQHVSNIVKRNFGVDVAQSLARYREAGYNPAEAFAQMTEEHFISKDKNYLAMRERARNAPEGERKEMYAQMADILRGGTIGKVLHQQHELMGLVTLLEHGDNYRRIKSDTLKNFSAGTVQADFDAIAGTDAFKVQQAENAKLFALTDAVDPVNKGFATLADRTVQLYTAFPALAQSIEGIKLLVATAAAALAGFGAFKLLSGAGAGGAAAASAAADAAIGTGGAAAVGGGALGLGALGAGIVLPGAAMSLASAKVAAGQAAIADNPLLSAMSGDMGFAAAIMNASGGAKEPSPEVAPLSTAEAQRLNGEVVAAIDRLAGRPLQIAVDGRVIAEATQATQGRDARRQ
jgi:hypothetical protein